MQKLKNGVWRVIELILMPVGFVVIGIALTIDRIAYWLDRRFNTKLRKPKITAEEIEQMIAASLPIGSNTEDIFSFLQTRSFPFSDKVHDYDPDYEKWRRSNLQQLPQHPENVKKMLIAKVDDVGKAILFRTDIRLTFYLDEQDSLIESVVEYLHTGL